MTKEELIISCTPPFLAVMLEIFNPISDAYLRREASILTTARGHVGATNLISGFAVGVGSISDLTTTGVSFFAGMAALILSVKNAPIYLYALVVFGIIIAAGAIRVLLRNPPFNIGTSLIPLPFGIRGHHFLPMTFGLSFKVIAWVANLGLIGVACMIYFGVLPIV
jgi:hypothetical protein